MGIGSALKQFHANNPGKSTLVIIFTVFASLTYLILQTIDSIVTDPAKKVQAETVEEVPSAALPLPPAPSAAPTALPPVSSPAPLTSAPGSLLPAAVSSPETRRSAAPPQ
ncbi:hypothetical protein [Rhodocyclus tenuis]|uniref:hypothetical protein n=1 Tax=Rhodocyclus tenuis TaxID=1066 RepID=UPI001907AB06|nr:hypothetical protein [Rhodocyclus tenuis]MBK1679548.1 hypothetical protein [Rhodocyclus tenuis]